MHTLLKAGICGLAAAAFLNTDMAMSGPTAATGVILTSITVGQIDPNGKVPTFNGVPGAGVGNFDIPTPQAILQHGFSYMFSMTTQNTTFSGTCKDSYRLTQVQGSTTVTLLSGVLNKSFTCAPGNIFGWALSGKAVPNSPGPATLVGTVTYGTSKVSMSVHVVIQ